MGWWILKWIFCSIYSTTLGDIPKELRLPVPFLKLGTLIDFRPYLKENFLLSPAISNIRDFHFDNVPCNVNLTNMHVNMTSLNTCISHIHLKIYVVFMSWAITTIVSIIHHLSTHHMNIFQWTVAHNLWCLLVSIGCVHSRYFVWFDSTRHSLVQRCTLLPQSLHCLSRLTCSLVSKIQYHHITWIYHE